MSLVTVHQSFNGFPSICFANDKLHYIESQGYNNGVHYVYNRKERKFKKLMDTKFPINMWFTGQNMVYLNTKQSIIVLSDKLHQYSFITNEWETWGGILQKSRKVAGSLVVTNDEKYIIIIGGYHFGHGDTDNIAIVDVEQKSLKEIDIKCPMHMDYKAIIVENGYYDELLVYGWIRDTVDRMTAVPIEIIQLIQEWIYHQDLHIIAS